MGFSGTLENQDLDPKCKEKTGCYLTKTAEPKALCLIVTNA